VSHSTPEMVLGYHESYKANNHDGNEIQEQADVNLEGYALFYPKVFMFINPKYRQEKLVRATI